MSWGSHGKDRCLHNSCVVSAQNLATFCLFLCCFPSHKVPSLPSCFSKGTSETTQVLFPGSPVYLFFSSSQISVIILARGVECREGKTSCLTGLENLCQLSGSGNWTVRNSCTDLLEGAPKSHCDCVL